MHRSLWCSDTCLFAFSHIYIMPQWNFCCWRKRVRDVNWPRKIIWMLKQLLLLKQLRKHLESHSLQRSFQSAYRKCCGSETASLYVVNDLLQASNEGHVSVSSPLVLLAAFHTIERGILIAKLCTTCGCSGTVWDWFISYLSCCTKSVFAGHESALSALKCGVPQSSVLGPLLVTLYTCPLCTVICQSDYSYHFFAHDSQLHSLSISSDFTTLPYSLKICFEDVTKGMSDGKC